jgi:hypothetical protein
MVFYTTEKNKSKEENSRHKRGQATFSGSRMTVSFWGKVLPKLWQIPLDKIGK